VNIHFDLVHPSDVNLFKNVINRLHEEGHSIFLTLRERGKLSIIAETELGSYKISKIGKHEKGFYKKLIALIIREVKFFTYLRKNKIQISVNQSFSSILSCKVLGIPFLNIEDDYEYKRAFHYARLFSTRDIMPDFIPAKGKNIYKYHGFKELAYLHPSVFQCDNTVPAKLGLVPLKYVFIREIANISLNYTNRRSFLEDVVELIHARGLQIILSLEDKGLSGQFENKCIILKEPVEDIYSLIANALFTISSGDTMAREACLTSTPTIYTGGREMRMNLPLIEKGIMYKADTFKDISRVVDFFLVDDHALKIRSEAKTIISKEWENTTEVIIKHIRDLTI
jgi:uncharacterized protein